jgi:ferredoxin
MGHDRESDIMPDRRGFLKTVGLVALWFSGCVRERSGMRDPVSSGNVTQTGKLTENPPLVSHIVRKAPRSASTVSGYTITEPCIGVKDVACVKVCPVDAIHPTSEESTFDAAEQLYIDPDTCIDCGVCEPECPVTAIFSPNEIPDKWRVFNEKGWDYYQLSSKEFEAKWGSPGRGKVDTGGEFRHKHNSGSAGA